MYRGVRAGLSAVLETVLDIALPPSCALCGTAGAWLCRPCRPELPLPRESVLDLPECGFRCATCEAACRSCERCLGCPRWAADLPITAEHRRSCGICSRPCGRCSGALIAANRERPACPECRLRRITACGAQQLRSQLEMLRWAFAYDGAMRELIWTLKYQHVRVLAGPMVDAAASLQRLPSGARVDAVVPIPMRGIDARRRGGNHADAIAEAVGERTGLPVRRDLLRRSRKRTVRQASITGDGGLDADGIAELRARRWANVQGAFEVRPERRAEAAGMRVLLVDDVATVTATLQSAARALRQAGADHVEAWALARNDRRLDLQ